MKTKIQIIKKSNVARIVDIPLNDFATLLKFDIPLDVIVVEAIDVAGVKKLDIVDKIRLHERLLDGDLQSVKYTNLRNPREASKAITNYNLPLNLYKKGTSTPDSKVYIEIDLDTYRNNRELFAYLGSINYDIVDSCVYIKLHKGQSTSIEVRFKPNKFGATVIYFYEENNTLLSFTERGPELVTDNAKITNFIDIVG